MCGLTFHLLLTSIISDANVLFFSGIGKMSEKNYIELHKMLDMVENCVM